MLEAGIANPPAPAPRPRQRESTPVRTRSQKTGADRWTEWSPARERSGGGKDPTGWRAHLADILRAPVRLGALAEEPDPDQATLEFSASIR